MCGEYTMPKTSVKIKMIGTPNRNEKSVWVQLAEDAERDAEKALTRSKQLSEAARIFRRNAESGESFAQSAGHVSGQQHSV
jgi:hypothetical protein